MHAELQTLGKDRICQIHCTDEDGVWLENNPRIDMPKVKRTLDEMDWSGWLVIERSRDARDSRNVRRNFGANASVLEVDFSRQLVGNPHFRTRCSRRKLSFGERRDCSSRRPWQPLRGMTRID